MGIFQSAVGVLLMFVMVIGFIGMIIELFERNLWWIQPLGITALSLYLVFKLYRFYLSKR